MRVLFKLQIKYAVNQEVANILDKLCYSAVADGIKPEPQLADCQEVLLILQAFKNFDSNKNKLTDLKNRILKNVDPQARFSSSKSKIDTAAALNTMIMHYQRQDAKMPEIEKGIDVAIAFLQRRQQYLDQVLASLSHLKTSQTQTSSNRKRKLTMFVNESLQAYNDKSAGIKLRKIDDIDDKAVDEAHSEPKPNDKNYFCT